MSDLCYTIVEREQLKNSPIPYTDNERETMWANVINETSWIDIVLIQCYMGWRPKELGNNQWDENKSWYRSNCSNTP